jgi:hypothetical protein
MAVNQEVQTVIDAVAKTELDGCRQTNNRRFVSFFWMHKQQYDLNCA